MTDDTVAASNQRPWARHVALTWAVMVGVYSLLVFTQAVLAGQFLSGSDALQAVHRVIGDDILPFLALAMVVNAAVLWRPGRGPGWPVLASLLLLIANVTQLSLGFAGRLDLHVPLGVGIFGASIVMLIAASRLLTTNLASTP